MTEKTSKNRKRKLIVHCGTAKTGTTRVQKFLSKNENILTSRGFYYPPMKGVFSYQHLSIVKSIAISILSDIGFPAGVPTIDIQEMKLRFAEEMETKNCDKLLFSSEFFWCCPLAQAKSTASYERMELVSKFLSVFKEIFSEYDISFVVWLRRQDSYEISMINQYVKEGRRVLVPQKYMKKKKPWLKYYDNLYILSEIFGHEKILAKIYSGADIMQEFLEFLGLDEDDGLSGVDAASRENSSVSARLFHVLRHVNMVEDDDLRKEILALSPHTRIFAEGRRFRPFRRELSDDILRIYKKDNRALARDWFQLDNDTPFEDDIVNGNELRGVPQHWTHKEVAELLEDVIRWKRGG